MSDIICLIIALFLVAAQGSGVTRPPHNITKFENDKVHLFCNLASATNGTVVWYRDGIQVQVEQISMFNMFAPRIQTSGNGSLVISRLVKEDSGLYECRISNGSILTKSGTANLSVEYPAQVTYSPRVQYLLKGQSGVINCYIKSNPVFQFVMWVKDGRLLDPFEVEGYENLNNGSLFINHVTENNEGIFKCTPYNSHGTTGSSSKMQIIVKDPLSASCANGTEPEVAKTKQSALSGTFADRSRLVDWLFTDYKKTVNPDKPDVRLGVALIDFHVDDQKQILESTVWLRYVWQDSRLAWNESEYGKVGILRYESKEVWKPDITLYNSADPVNQIRCWDSNALIYPSGEVLWTPPCKLVSRCRYTLDKEPYGEQTCSLKFGSWTFDALAMNLDFYSKTETSIDLLNLSLSSSTFEIVRTTSEKNTKYYRCCTEPYQDLTFNITIKRIPE